MNALPWLTKALEGTPPAKGGGKSGIFRDRSGKRYKLDRGKRVPLGNDKAKAANAKGSVKPALRQASERRAQPNKVGPVQPAMRQAEGTQPATPQTPSKPTSPALPSKNAPPQLPHERMGSLSAAAGNNLVMAVQSGKQDDIAHAYEMAKRQFKAHEAAGLAELKRQAQHRYGNGSAAKQAYKQAALRFQSRMQQNYQRLATIAGAGKNSPPAASSGQPAPTTATPQQTPPTAGSPATPQRRQAVPPPLPNQAQPAQRAATPPPLPARTQATTPPLPQQGQQRKLPPRLPQSKKNPRPEAGSVDPAEKKAYNIRIRKMSHKLKDHIRQNGMQGLAGALKAELGGNPLLRRQFAEKIGVSPNAGPNEMAREFAALHGTKQKKQKPKRSALAQVFGIKDFQAQLEFGGKVPWIVKRPVSDIVM